MLDRNNLILSIFKENTIPNISPVIVAAKPIKNPVRKKDLIIDFFGRPNDFKNSYLFSLILN